MPACALTFFTVISGAFCKGYAAGVLFFICVLGELNVTTIIFQAEK